MTKKIVIPDKKKDIVTFTTSLGVTVVIKSIPQLLLDRIQASVEKPEPPKYVITTASGEEVWENHTKDTLESDDDKRLYGRYLKDLEIANAKINENMFKVIVMKGIDIKLPTETSWIDMQRFLGVTIPEDPLELKYLYVETEVIGNTDDIMALTSLVMEMSGVPEEALADARKSFQSLVQKQKPPEDGGTGQQQVEG